MCLASYSYDPVALFDVDKMRLENELRFYEVFSELISEPTLGMAIETNQVFNARNQSIVDVVYRTRSKACTILYTGTGPVLWADDTADGHDAEIADLFGRLSWSDEVLRALRDVESSLSISKAAAIHVRRGVSHIAVVVSLGRLQKTEDCLNFAHRYVPLDAYIQCIKIEAPSGLLAFFSDSDAAIEELSSRYPGRVVDGRTILNALRLSEPQRALVELILISRARMVIGGGSQFCQLPSKLGGLRCINPMRYASVTSIVSDVAGLIT